jgi:hypothetical protein
VVQNSERLMLGFAALAEVPLAAEPQGSDAPPPTPPGPPTFIGQRFPDGKVFYVNPPSLIGPIIPFPVFYQSESCAFIFESQIVTPLSQILFTAPDGTQHFGDPDFLWAGVSPLVNPYTRNLPDVPANSYTVFISGLMEFLQLGTWTAQIISGTAVSTYTFDVKSRPHF